MVLNNVEADRLNWTSTDKIDRIHCAHAQRHTLGTQTFASYLSVKKNKNPQSQNGVICRYFQDVPVSILHVTEQPASFIGMSVKLVRGTMQPKMVIKSVGKKLGSHCSNAVGERKM